MKRRDLRHLDPQTRQQLARLGADDRAVPLLAALRTHHRESLAHCFRVGLICLDVARDLYASNEERLHLGRAGLLHDIGKLGVNVNILAKPTSLTDEERHGIRSHCRFGFDALHEFDHEPTRLAVLAHHGFGPDPYPDDARLNGADDGSWSATDRRLGLEMAQVVAVVDVIDALSSRRAYRGALDAQEVDATLEREFRGESSYVDLVLRGG